MEASYAVHTNCKSHKGGVIFSAGVRLPAQLGKQKLNTKSSIEVEFVGVSNYFPHTIWVKMFLEAQG